MESKRAEGGGVTCMRGRSKVYGAELGGVERGPRKEWGEGISRVMGIYLLLPCYVGDGNGAVSIELNSAGKERWGGASLG